MIIVKADRSGKQVTGTYQAGFLIFAALAIAALLGLTAVKRRWRTTWAPRT